MPEIVWLCPEAKHLVYLRESSMVPGGGIHSRMGPPGAEIMAYESADVETGRIRYWYVFTTPGLLDGIGAIDHIQPGYKARCISPASIIAGMPTLDAKPLKSIRKVARAFVRFQFRAHLDWRRRRRDRVLTRLGRFLEWLKEDFLCRY